MLEAWMWASVILCIIGCGLSSYKRGIRDGGAMMIDMLEDIGVVVVDENDNVKPNMSYRVPKD